MAPALGVWSAVLEPGKDTVVEAPADIQVTNVSFGEQLADEKGRTVIKLSYESPAKIEDSDGEEDEEDLVTTVLCALTAGKVESTTTSIILERDEKYIFQATGKNVVHLSGNYIDQAADYDQDPNDSELDGFDSGNDAYDLRDVSSDVEMHPDDLDALESDASRFEELDEQTAPAKTPKRTRESDTTGKGLDSAAKAEKKSKKLKGEGGKAVAVGDEAKSDEKEKKEKKKEKKGVNDEEQKHPEKTTAGGVTYKDSTIGAGPMAKKGNTVLMRYKGRLTNGKVFDENVKGKPFTFHLGKGEVIKGWDEGIVGMQAGGERLLTIPPNMGYGKRGTDGIPPNAKLIFEVKLLEIK